MDSDIAYSAIRISTPLIYAALGGLLTYQAGILNIALDGFMIVSAFAAIAVAYATESLTLGVIAGTHQRGRARRSPGRLQLALQSQHFYRRHRGDFPGLWPDCPPPQGPVGPGRRVLLGPHSDLSAPAHPCDRRRADHRPDAQRPYAARLPRLPSRSRRRLLPLSHALGSARARRRRSGGRRVRGGDQHLRRSSSRRCCSPDCFVVLPARISRWDMCRCSPSR